MLCPLRPKQTQGIKEAPKFGDCFKDECAWFDKDNCAIKNLTSITDLLNEIEITIRKHE
jgi:hypothetical protein